MNTTDYIETIPSTRPHNTYEFTYYGFIPSYNDFDQEWITIKAKCYKDALNELKSKSIYSKYQPVLSSFNGKSVTPEMFGTEII